MRDGPVQAHIQIEEDHQGHDVVPPLPDTAAIRNVGFLMTDSPAYNLNRNGENRTGSEAGENHARSDVGENQARSEAGENHARSEVGENQARSEAGENRPGSEI